jgi:hypothetical protein
MSTALKAPLFWRAEYGLSISSPNDSVLPAALADNIERGLYS